MLGGATRRLVIKARLPAGEAGAAIAIGLTARWSVPGDETRFACEVAVPALRFDTASICLAQPRAMDRAKSVVEQWVAHVYHRAMVLTQDGEGRAAATFVERDRKYLERYCAGIPELQAVVAELGAFGHSVHHTYAASTSKEVLLRAYKTSRGEMNHRSRATLDYASLSAIESARRTEESS